MLKSRDYRLEGLEWLYSESEVMPMEDEVLCRELALDTMVILA